MTPKLKYNNQTIADNIEVASSGLDQTIGLMFRLSIPEKYAMIFDLGKPTSGFFHMLFVFFSIDVILLDENMHIIGLATLKPFTGSVKVDNARWIIEMKAGAIEKFKLKIGGKVMQNHK